MMESLSINLKIRSDIDQELFEALSQIPKGKGRAEYLRRLLNQAKVKSLIRTMIPRASEKELTPKATEPLKKPVAESPKRQQSVTKVAVVSEPLEVSQTSEFEMSFASALGGVPQR